MTSNAPWSVKGIDPKARDAAKTLARRSGLTLGEWLNQRINEDFEELEEIPARSPVANEGLERLAARIEAAEQRSALAVAGVDQAVRGALARIENGEREQVSVGARFEGALQDAADDRTRLSERLARLEHGLSGSGSPEAFRALEATIGRIANQVYDSEGRARDSLSDLRRDLTTLAAKVEATGPLDGAVPTPLMERMHAAETRTTNAIATLEASFSQLERRLAAAEGRLEGGDGPISASIDLRLGEIAANLARGVEAARTEMAEQLRASADGRLSRLEDSLSEMTGHVEVAERRSAHAVEQMGHEVLRVAEALSHKVQRVEQRSADAIERVGGEVAKVIGQLDGRIARSDSVQTQTLERLSTEITRISERLTERIGIAERRSAQAIDDVGEQVSRVTERLNQRYERSSSDLAERIRQSEERTARLLEDAKERIDRRLTDVRERQAGPASRIERQVDLLDAPAFPAAEVSSAPIYPDVAPFGQAFAPEAFAAEGFTPVTPAFEPADIEAAQNFPAMTPPQSEADFVDEPASVANYLNLATAFQPAPEVVAAAEPAPDLADIASDEPNSFGHAAFEPEPDTPDFGFQALNPPPPAEPDATQRALSTKELIEQARAAAKAHAERGSSGWAAQATPAARPSDPGAFGGGGYAARRGSRRRRHSKTLLAASFAVAAVMLMGGGLIYTVGGKSVLPSQVVALFTGKQEAPANQPVLAVALNPRPIDAADLELEPSPPASAEPASTPSTEPGAAQLYRDGRLQVEAGRSAGLESVRRAANLGHAQAQAYLGSLYKNGRGGVTKDLAQARRWYERAAAGGDRNAMHEVALMLYNGDGGAKNLTSAAQWFRRAADAGSTDSQYNLGLLYEQGVGVGKNPAEAYKWFLMAARDTDPAKRVEARTAAERVRGLIGPEAQAAAERIAGGYGPTPTVTPASASAPPASGVVIIDIADSQRALTRLGYFRGSVDGMLTPDLRNAVREFQRDQGLATTGNLDTATASKLQTASR